MHTTLLSEPSGTGTRTATLWHPVLQLRQHQCERLVRAGAGRDDVLPGRPRPSQVVVREVEELLVVGERVHGVDPPALDAEGLVQHGEDRRDAVGGARRVGDDPMGARVEASLSLTPRQMVASAESVGVETITRLAPASR